MMQAFVLAAALLVAGCAQFWGAVEGAKERAVDLTARAVAEYCEAPADVRARFRADLERAAAPHAARIDCAE